MKLQRSFNRNTFHYYHSVATGALLVHHETSDGPAISSTGLLHSQHAVAGQREPEQHNIHLSDALRSGMAPGERFVGKTQLHYIYIVYSVIITVFIWSLSIFVGNEFRSVSDDMLGYLNTHQIMGADFNQLSQILLSLGHAGLSQICAVAGIEGLPWSSDVISYQRIGDFFASYWWRWGTELFLISASVLYFIFRLLEMKETEIVVTNDHLIYKHGILIVRTLKIKLNQVDRADVNQTWLGNLLGYGSIHIYTHAWQTQGTGTSEHLAAAGVFLPPVAAPHKFTALVEMHKEIAKSEKSK